MTDKAFMGLIFIGVLFFITGYWIGSSAESAMVYNDNSNTVYELENQISELESEIEYLENQLENSNLRTLELDYADMIDDIVVKQHYEWDYNTEWSWDLSIPLSLYLEYYSKERPAHTEGYVHLAMDSGDDYIIEQIVDALETAADDYGFNTYETVMYVISFIQSLPYTEDSVEARWDEYPRYPVETLFDRGGDCEDTSILVCALLSEMGYDTCLFILEDEKHCAVGIAGGEGITGSYYLADETKYFYLETTGEGWNLGEIPPSIKETSAKIFPLKDY